jgi:hypothetical protein
MPKLHFKETGEEVKEGDTILDFRNEEWAFINLTRGGTRVQAKQGKGMAREFFPGVFPACELRES